MKKSIFFFTVAILFFGFFGCSEKSVTHSEPKKEKSVKESLTKDLPVKFQDDLMFVYSFPL